MYIDSLKALLSFSSLIIEDSVSNSFFNVNGEDTDVIVSTNGYKMKSRQYLNGDLNIEMSSGSSISNGLTISFSLVPVSPGLAINPYTGLTESLRMPLLNFVRTDIGTDTPIIIYETTGIDNNNYLNIEFLDETSLLYSLFTFGPYSPFIFHYFWISLDLSSGEIFVFIDGKSFNDLNGSNLIPSFSYLNAISLEINKNTEDDYSYYIASNYGIIQDIAIFNEKYNDISFIQKVLNYGISYAVEEDNVPLLDQHQSLLFNDPSMIKITSFVDDMSFIYLARSDGKILKGSPLFWESRRVFSEINELNSISDTVTIEGGDEASIDNGFLKINDSIVRL